MSEKQRLLSPEYHNDDAKVLKNEIASERDSLELFTAMKNEQETIGKLQDQLSKECERSARLETKLDTLMSQFDNFLNKHSKDMDAKSKDIARLENALEARQELQNSTIDELKFQVQTLRKKLAKVTNGDVKTNNIMELNDKPLVRRYSNDSVGSNPSYISHTGEESFHGQTVWRVNSLTKKLKRITAGNYDDPSRSEPFTAGTNAYRFSVWAYLNGRGKGAGKCLSVYVRLVASEYDAILSWPIKPTYTLTLINQDPAPAKRLDLVRVRDLSIKNNSLFRPQKDDKSLIVGFDDFILHDDLEKKNFLVDDTLFIKCSVDISLN